MSDPVGPSGGQGLLEGLSGGFESGYGFREGIKGRRRAQQLTADLMTLRQQEAGREQTVFDEQQQAYHKAEALRDEVGRVLASPQGNTTQGQPSAGTPPLSADAITAREVGRTLGEFGGRDLSDRQALLVGSGQVPYGAIAPKSYHPRTRAEWLDNLRIAAGLRAQGTKLPITMDHAFTTLDRIYTVQDQKTGAWVSKLKPSERLRIAKKMVAGTIQPGDFPDLKDEAPTAGGPAPAAGGGRSLLQRIGDVFTGGPGAASAAPTPGAAPSAAPPEPEGGAPDLEQARQLISQYRDLPQDDLEGALRDQGYDEETIRTILGSTHP